MTSEQSISSFRATVLVLMEFWELISPLYSWNRGTVLPVLSYIFRIIPLTHNFLVLISCSITFAEKEFPSQSRNFYLFSPSICLTTASPFSSSKPHNLIQLFPYWLASQVDSWEWDTKNPSTAKHHSPTSPPFHTHQGEKAKYSLLAWFWLSGKFCLSVSAGRWV